MRLHFFLKTVTPKTAVSSTNTIKMKNSVWAIEAAPCAIPVKPKIAATIAITRKIADHLSIIVLFLNFF